MVSSTKKIYFEIYTNHFKCFFFFTLKRKMNFEQKEKTDNEGNEKLHKIIKITSL